MKKVVATLGMSLAVLGFAGAVHAEEHTVTEGETLSELSNSYNTTINELVSINNIADPDMIYIGQVINTKENNVNTNKETNVNTNVEPKKETNVSHNDEDLLARIVTAEANGESYAGKVGVANVILNRVESEEFPNTIHGVIYDAGQFSPVTNGSINKAPTQEAHKAVQGALNGENNVGDSLYFWASYVPSDSWVWTNEVTTTIGNHVFAK